MTAIVPVFLLLLNSLNPSADSCVYNSFLGSYGAYSVFRPDLSCLQSFGTFPSSSVIPCAHREAHRLVWVQQQAVEESSVNSTKHGLDDFLARLSQSKLGTHREDESQAVFSDRDPQGTHWETIHRTSTSLLLSIPSNVALNVDTLLPPFYKSFILPSAPTEYRPIPTPAVDHIKRLLQNLTFNPEVASIVSNISIDQMHNDIRWLTGEDARSPIDSRHSFTSGSRLASEWLKDRFEQTGATCKLEPFSEGFAPNVICNYPGSLYPSSTVILGSHYDSRGSFGSIRAPGADDDGSGVTALLAIARAIKRRRVQFQTRVEICAFAGEEQGLIGSRSRARDLRAEDANITLMIQGDMLAYRAPGEPPQLGLPLVGLPEAAQLLGNISAIYSPELTVGTTTACCSDHQSFYEHGFPAVSVFERAGPIADPMYHNSGDLSDREGFDFEQLKSIAKVQLATLLHTAGFDLKGEEGEEIAFGDWAEPVPGDQDDHKVDSQ